MRHDHAILTPFAVHRSECGEGFESRGEPSRIAHFRHLVALPPAGAVARPSVRLCRAAKVSPGRAGEVLAELRNVAAFAGSVSRMIAID